MVFYFTSEVVEPPATIYMGLDKYENEDLLKYALPSRDIWWHVHNLSSAHVYLRLPKGKTMEDIPTALLEDCAQLVKANSIQGNKTNNVEIVFTEASNLKKSADMDVGQVAFYNSKKVKTIKVEKRNNSIINRLNKTKVERFPCLQTEREEYDRLERYEIKEAARKTKEIEKIQQRHKEEEQKLSQLKLVCRRLVVKKIFSAFCKLLQKPSPPSGDRQALFSHIQNLLYNVDMAKLKRQDAADDSDDFM